MTDRRTSRLALLLAVAAVTLLIVGEGIHRLRQEPPIHLSDWTLGRSER